MATMAAPMSVHGEQYHAFGNGTSPNSAHMAAPIQSEPLDDQYIALFCRALYDYEAQDASALSFRRDDIIEVLTQQPSGWWDGLLGDERGWFPSNYVTIISDEEAELAFSGTDISSQNQDSRRESVVDMSHAMLRGSQVENEDWLEGEVGQRATELNISLPNRSSQPSDFWLPEVTPDGQIYYVNSQTGQRARDLPMEADDEASDSDLAGLHSQSSSRSGTSAGLGLSSSVSESSRAGGGGNPAGFGLPRRTGTPEPWVRKLADDGMSYYYWNKVDGNVQWARPEASSSRGHSIPPASSSSSSSDQRKDRLRSGSDASQLSHKNRNGTSRMSVYSDDSDVQPIEAGHLQANGQIRNGRIASPKHVRGQFSATELTSAERIAHMLQTALAPPPPDLITDLSAAAKRAIQAVVNNLQVYSAVRRPEDEEAMDHLVNTAVATVRDLLYVSAAPTGHIPSSVIPKEARDRKGSTASQALLKPAQRKVTATLSKLVLSARAMQYDSGSSALDTPNRIEGDAEELERAIVSFVLEVQRTQAQSDEYGTHGLKRLRGVYSTAHVGAGLVGAGAGGSWKGFGWVSVDDDLDPPSRILGTEVITELSAHLARLEDSFSTFEAALKGQQVRLVHAEGQFVLTQLSSCLIFVANIHVARHVDIDGIRHSDHAPNELYAETINKARLLVRTLEAAVQSLYDGSAALLLAIQAVRYLAPDQVSADNNASYDYLDALSVSLKSTLGIIQQTFEALLSLGHDQAELAQGDYNGSIEWRMSRLSVIDNQFGGALRPASTFLADFDQEGEDLVDMEHAFRKQEFRSQDSITSSHDRTLYNESTAFSQSESTSNLNTFSEETFITPESPEGALKVALDKDGEPAFLDDELAASTTSPVRAGAGAKLRKLLGPEAPEHYINTANADAKPWYLRPNYDQNEIVIDPDGAVRAGTVPALVERLTAHDAGADSTFIKTFLMTYKSFTTLDELFELLVQRFCIQPPAKLTPSEREEWVKLKQNVIQIRVLNTFKAMVVDDDVLEKEDLYILDRMKTFISTEEVSRFAAAKQLMILIERTRGGDTMIKKITSQQPPPPPILPKTSKKLKLLDVDPLELARQLTILESQLYQRIRPIECLQRSREQKDEHHDNIATVIQTSNRIADWVAESILSKEDSRKRAFALKQFISVADRCRTLHNYSTMVAITSGLNTPPIRRLKRTWEQVNQRYMSQLAACEMTLDTTKNFNNYRSTMALVTPPCVPFIGVFLTTLQFIQDGSKDNLPGNLVNFRKRQKASEVILDIKRWQSQPFNFQRVPAVYGFIEESLNQFSDAVDVRDRFWNLSLEREPREREDEKMARLLQESGFL